MPFWPWRNSRKTEQKPLPKQVGHQLELLVICHSRDSAGMAIMENICTALEFSKIPFALLDLDRQTAWPNLQSYSSVVICSELIFDLGVEKTDRLKDYVQSGGGLFVGFRCWNENLSELFGFADHVHEPETHDTTGLSISKEIVPGASGMVITDADWLFDHNRLDINSSDLLASCTILVNDIDERPLAWRLAFGKGQVVYWNTGVLYCRTLRGFALHTIMDTMKVAAAAIAGFAMFHVDDFPAALSERVAEPVASEFPGLDWNGFFFDVWYRDMMKLRAKHGLKYTWYIVMDYADVDNGPDADLNSPAATEGKDILVKRFQRCLEFAVDDEFGFHGYNHDPMITKFWPDDATLRLKLERARRLWEDVVPAPMPVSWVPANNWYNAVPLRILKEVFPEIATICGLFSIGEFDYGEYREFGPEPWENSLICLPRETSGHSQIPETRMMMLSQLAALGVWSHFLHADDIYDIPVDGGETTYLRNPERRLWRALNADGLAGLYRQLDDWITQVKSLYPWLEFLTTSQARKRYDTHAHNKSAVFVCDRNIEIHSTSQSLFYIKTQEGGCLHPGKGGELIDSRQVSGGVLNVVRCEAGNTSFEMTSG